MVVFNYRPNGMDGSDAHQWQFFFQPSLVSRGSSRACSSYERLHLAGVSNVSILLFLVSMSGRVS